MRLKNCTLYPPEPQCNDDLMPEDLPDALDWWKHKCDAITIEQLQAENEQLKQYCRCKSTCALNTHPLNTKCTCGWQALKGDK